MIKKTLLIAIFFSLGFFSTQLVFAAENSQEKTSPKLQTDSPKIKDATSKSATVGEPGNKAAVPTLKHTVQSDNFRVHASNLRVAVLLATHAEDELSRILKSLFEFAQTPGDIIYIYLWESQADYMKAVPDAPEDSPACTSEYSDATGKTKFRIDIWRENSAKKLSQEILNRIIPHEISHVIFGEFFKIAELTSKKSKSNKPIESKSPCPLALLEGFAILAEKTSQDRRIILNGLILGNNDPAFSLPSLLDVNKYDQTPDIAVFYAQAYSFAQFLQSKLTKEQFGELLENMRQGQEFATALQRALYLPESNDFIEQLEKAWKQYAMMQYKLAKSLEKPTQKPRKN